MALLEGGKRAEADALSRESIGLARRLARDDEVRLSLEHGDAYVAGELGRLEEAEQKCRDVLARRKAKHGDHHVDTMTTLENLAAILDRCGRHHEAEAILTRAVEDRQRISGAEHPDTLRVTNNLAASLFQRGQYARVEPMFRQLAEARELRLGPTHRITCRLSDCWPRRCAIPRSRPSAPKRASCWRTRWSQPRGFPTASASAMTS